jgi:hypothetical protein
MGSKAVSDVCWAVITSLRKKVELHASKFKKKRMQYPSKDRVDFNCKIIFAGHGLFPLNTYSVTDMTTGAQRMSWTLAPFDHLEIKNFKT